NPPKAGELVQAIKDLAPAPDTD
ncbi:MAG: hypothetical protein ABR589_09125, partial [Chthoniobacterales bacterium]